MSLRFEAKPRHVILAIVFIAVVSLSLGFVSASGDLTVLPSAGDLVIGPIQFLEIYFLAGENSERRSPRVGEEFIVNAEIRNIGPAAVYYFPTLCDSPLSAVFDSSFVRVESGRPRCLATSILTALNPGEETTVWAPESGTAYIAVNSGSTTVTAIFAYKKTNASLDPSTQAARSTVPLTIDRASVVVVSAVIQSDTMWVDSFGFFHVFGEVKNTGNVWLEYVKIVGTFRDSGGGIVDVESAFTGLDKLPPGMTAPFDLTELDKGKVDKIQTYSLLLDFQEAVPGSVKLVVLNVADSKNSLGWLEVVGEVENRGNVSSTYTKIVATFYHGSSVVYSELTFANPESVPAGARHPFKLTVSSSERSNIIDRYSLTAESEEYTSVPEWPAPMLLAAVVLSLAAIVARQKRRRDRLLGARALQQVAS